VPRRLKLREKNEKKKIYRAQAVQGGSFEEGGEKEIYYRSTTCNGKVFMGSTAGSTERKKKTTTGKGGASSYSHYVKRREEEDASGKLEPYREACEKN